MEKGSEVVNLRSDLGINAQVWSAWNLKMIQVLQSQKQMIDIQAQ